MSFHQLYLEYPDVLDHVNLDASNKPVLAEVKIKNKNLHRWFTSASLSVSDPTRARPSVADPS